MHDVSAMWYSPKNFSCENTFLEKFDMYNYIQNLIIFLYDVIKKLSSFCFI